MFKGKKTILVCFTRNVDRTNTTLFIIKGKIVILEHITKILGVVIDTELRYKQYIAKAATRGLTAAMALKRLRMVSPLTARQLFRVTVAPVVDYALNIWMYACGVSAIAIINRVQRIGAQAITGTFYIVATAIREAEVSIRLVRERHLERATKLQVDLRTLHKTNPLLRLRTKMLQRFTSLLQKIAYIHRDTLIDKIEVI